MRKIEIYEPAGCASGFCDPAIEKDLLRMEHLVQDLRERGVSISRYNIIDDGPAFLANEAVKTALVEDGVEALPFIVVEGKLESKGEYPTDLEFAKWAGLPWSDLANYANIEKRANALAVEGTESGCGKCG
ncbi:arsenic metallochaperone ArsD family protein [Acetobacterium bakii]|uniref:Arsenic resistance operon repressor n=1 Tax=Acetobacterium bakii TaxID=52689 RepID=A0A0L6U451_9FIRM|nr:arsenic metallochaperone ArsD family protein [Acetobacterium bakii]KNZ43112.1 hypothetical protein AKG39_02890 [Acetobacterium bakii]